MHVKRISVPRRAVTIDCTWLENNLPESLFDLVSMALNWFKGAAI